MQSSSESLRSTSTRSFPVEPLLLDELAERIATTSLVMGMDDHDEKLLWRYLSMRREHAASDVIRCLKSQAEMPAFEVRMMVADVRIAAQWVKPRGLLRRQRDLTDQLVFVPPQCPFVDFRSRDAIVQSTTLRARQEAFRTWYEQLQACTVGGRVVEVSADEIDVDMRIDGADLRELLHRL